MKKSILGIICAILVIAFANSCGNSTGTGSNANDSTAIADSLDSVSKKEWVYQNSVDEMDGSTQKFAYLVSSNTVDFDFPYSGGSNLRIIIAGDCGVGVGISKGQFNSNEFNGTNYVTVRFDNDAPIKFLTFEPSDYSSDMLILGNSKTFIKLAKKAKRIKIEAPFFTEGWRLFTFSTNKPLEW